MITRLECDHFEIYRNIKSIHCIPETHSVTGQLYYKNEQKNHRKRRQVLWLPEMQLSEGNGTKIVKGYKLSVRR